MVVLSQPIVDELADLETCKATSAGILAGIPVVDLSNSDCKKLIVEACKDFGFFKLINHGVSMEFLNKLESEALKFFQSPQQEKQISGPPNYPFGYGNKKIGPNGDTGWVEYLLLPTNPEFISHNSQSHLPGISHTFWCLVKEYICIVRNMACKVLEMIAEEMKMGPTDVLSKLIRDDKSDSCFRVNYYPPCPDLQALSGRNFIGFGEHTDPQIISVGRCNNIWGLQICLKNGTWVSIPPDQASFYFNVGDSLQVMTNGRFRSVKHRVVTHSLNSRVSMIYFGGPALSEKIAPLSSLMDEGEEGQYREFTWSEYKKSAYNTRLGDNRLGIFEKSHSK